MSRREFSQLSQEEQVLAAVKATLTGVIKDTATAPGMKHPLSDKTINGLRECLQLITQREAELAELAGDPQTMRPYFNDSDNTKSESVVPLSELKRGQKDE